MAVEGTTLRIGNRCGFTLIELVLVGLIILIMVSVSVPMFRRTFSNVQLDETAYNIVKFMNYARAKAIAERVRAKLDFDFDTGEYRLTVNTNPDDPN